MNKGKSLLTRRKFAAMGLAGGASTLLGGCCDTILVIKVNVVGKDGRHYVEDIDEAVPKGVTKIHFVPGTPGWVFMEKTSNAGSVGAGPRVWFDGEEPLGAQAFAKLSADKMTCETNKVPTAGKPVHVYFAMKKAPIPKTAAEETPEAPPGAALGAGTPKTDGDCGGGGDIEAGH